MAEDSHDSMATRLSFTWSRMQVLRANLRRWVDVTTAYRGKQALPQSVHIASHMAERVRAAVIQPRPAPYVFVEDVLPPEVYAGVHDALRGTAPALKEQIHEGDPNVFFGSYRDRLEVRIPEGLKAMEADAAAYWKRMRAALESQLFFDAMFEKFEPGFRERFGAAAVSARLRRRLRPTTLVTRHRANYYLGPHTDRFEKVITCIFNCPERGGLEHLGTAMYEPKQVGFTCRGIVHHDPRLFHLTQTVPFRPNSALMFFRDDRLFHGVERLTPESLMGSDRANVQFNLWDR